MGQFDALEQGFNIVYSTRAVSRLGDGPRAVCSGGGRCYASGIGLVARWRALAGLYGVQRGERLAEVVVSHVFLFDEEVLEERLVQQATLFVIAP
ncbi:hypothetical protein ACFWY9_10425 [Amycolatopsis sp. NPDC059027]|uniref:hypothetical protein n=1 Tax=Amycolatopsis sp. NPDC059027 TaxID=3346709 RepID=UPI003672D237